jgi:hypothetical protein
MSSRSFRRCPQLVERPAHRMKRGAAGWPPVAQSLRAGHPRPAAEVAHERYFSEILVARRTCLLGLVGLVWLGPDVIEAPVDV